MTRLPVHGRFRAWEWLIKADWALANHDLHTKRLAATLWGAHQHGYWKRTYVT